MKVIIIEQGKAPYFKDIDLEKYNDNMNTYAEAEIDCDYIDRVQILPNYELTIYVDDLNSRRDDSELNFFVKGVQYDLPVKGKAVVSRGEVYLDEIEYQDTTEQDMETLLSSIYFPNQENPFSKLKIQKIKICDDISPSIFYKDMTPEQYVFEESKFNSISKDEKRKFLISAENQIWTLDDAIDFNRTIISIDEKYDVVADREWWRRVFELAVGEWKKAYPKNGEFD